MSDAARDVSPAAAALIALVPTLTGSELGQIERLLLAHLAEPSASELRQARLGLLIEMVSELDGVVPTVDEYSEIRGRRAQAGETWPHATTLIRAYSSSWHTAVRAAMRMANHGSSSRVPSSHSHATRTLRYSRAEILAGLTLFFDEHDGRWPSPTQYHRWATLNRKAAQAGGQRDPRLPSNTVIRREFGTFIAAVAAARHSHRT